MFHASDWKPTSDNKGLALKGSFMQRISPPNPAGLLYLLLLLSAAGVPALRDVKISVPEAAASGDTVALQCRYDLENDQLYSVKWYMGRSEFFRYIPKELPNTRVFPLTGIDVDVSRSGPLTVVLRAVQPSLSGRYRCEVSADAPSFHTVMKTSYMHVVELPDSAPTIYAEKNRVSVGENLQVTCTAPPSHPPANLTWKLNGKQVKGTSFELDAVDITTKKPYYNTPNWSKQMITTENNAETNKDLRIEHQFNSVVLESEAIQKHQTNKPLNEHSSSHERLPASETADDISRRLEANREDFNLQFKPVTETAIKYDTILKKRSRSIFSIPISQDIFDDGLIKISCRATVFTLYSAEAQISLDEDKPQIAPILGNKLTPTGAGTSTNGAALFCILPFIVQHLVS